jgi:superfamily II DNA or RNA helicase
VKFEITIAGDLSFSRGNIPRPMFDALMGVLSREVPARGAKGRVTGTRRVSLVEERGGRVHLPRGALQVLRDVAARSGVELSWRSAVVGAEQVGALRPAALGIDLRPYQQQAVIEMHRRVQCLVKLPCGGGKTTIGAAAIVAFGIPALVVVPTRDILDQWVEVLDRAGADRVWVAGKRTNPPRPGQVVVGTPQSITPKLANGVGVVVVDECHRTLAKTWLELLSSCPARYRWGLTATVERSDKQEWALPYVFGPVVEPATTNDLVRAGWLASPRVLAVATGWRASELCRPVETRCGGCGWLCSEPLSVWEAGRLCGRCRRETVGLGQLTGEHDPIAWGKAIHELTIDRDRNALLLRLAQAAVDGGRSVLALVPSIAQTVELAAQARGLGLATASLSGNDSKTRRRETVAALRAGRLQVVFGTKVADEGLDVPELGCVILADPGRAQGRTLQRAGRSMRPKGRTPFVVDLVDADPEMRSQWRSRRRAYVREFGPNACDGDVLEPENVIRLLADVW